MVSAVQDTETEQPSWQGVSQAQATLASLFGRGATMPSVPRMSGTIALPSFDSRGMKVDEGSLDGSRGTD